MRPLVRLAWFVVPCGMLACSALLGDFTISNGVPDASDSGADVVDSGVADVSQADVDAGPPLFKLRCSETASSRIQITQGDSLHPDLIRVAVMPTTQIRVVLADYEPADSGGYVATIQSYTVDIHNQNTITPAPLLTTSNQVLAIERYDDGVKSGFAVLYPEVQTTLNTTYLMAARLPDDQAGWTTPVTLADLGGIFFNNIEGDFTVINAASDDYFVAFSNVDTTAHNQIISGAEVKAGNTSPLTTLASLSAPANRNIFDLVRPGVAWQSPVGYVLLNPSGNNGPPPIGTPTQLLRSQGGNVTITPPSNLNYFPAGFVNAFDPLKVNTAWLLADLTNLNGSYGVGQLAFSTLGTVDPSKLPQTTTAAFDGGSIQLKDLFVGNSSGTHWERVNLIEQLILTGPTEDPLTQTFYGGLNLGWWDGPTGSLRAYVAGDGRLFADVPFILNTDATITNLVGSIAQLEVAYESAQSKPTQNNPPTPSDLWIAGIGCVK